MTYKPQLSFFRLRALPVPVLDHFVCQCITVCGVIVY